MNCDAVGVVQLQGEQVEESPDAVGHCVSGWSWHAAAARLLLATGLDGQMHPLTLSCPERHLCPAGGITHGHDFWLHSISPISFRQTAFRQCTNYS